MTNTMKKNERKVLSLFVMLAFSLSVFAQNITVRGTVQDVKGEPVIGASVIVQGEQGKGTSTNVNGKFELANVKPTATLLISYVGMQSQTVVLNGQSTVNVTLEEDNKSLSEIVVVGYGTQKKANLTGAVAAISGDELTKRPVTNPVTMLQGQVPGLRIVQGLGQPGAESVQIRVRGQGTYSSAGNDPLILIDGVPGTLSNLNPNDIESVSVLKDAASSAIYGARAANGVLLVTTKTGAEGKFRIEYSGNFASHTPTRMLKLVTNSAEYMRLFNEAKTNSGIASATNTYPQATIDLYDKATDRVKYPNFDWLDYMFNPAFVQSHNLSLNGGSKNTTYNITLAYVNQPGTMKGFEYEKFNFRTNLKSQLKSWATIGANIGFEKGNRKQPRQGQDDTFLATLAQAPTYAPFLPDGRYTDKAFSLESNNKNTVAIVENGVLKTDVNYEATAQLWSDIKLAKGLAWYSKVAVNFVDNSYKDWRPSVNLYNFTTGNYSRLLDVGGEGLTSGNNRNYYTNFFTYLKYDFNLANAHNISLQIGYNQEYNNYQYVEGYRQKFVSNTLQELNAGTEAIQNAYGSSNEWALQSLFARLNYNYKERYLFEANMRYDGTSRIKKDYRWGTFPSFSAAWRITEEDFMKNANIGWLSNVKLRASYGVLGNQNIGLYPYQVLLSYTGAYPFDNSALLPGVTQTALSNDKIKWESTALADVGIDLLLFNKLSITYDWYRKHTYDILRGAQVTGVVGLSAPTINKGDLLNYGHELTVQYNDRINGGTLKGLMYGGGFYIDIFRNKLINYGTKDISGYYLYEDGQPYETYYMLEQIGIFQTPEEITNSPKQFSDNVKPGDFKYRDTNGDGVVNSDDRIPVAGRFPKFEYSFNGNAAWKGFDISLLFQGVSGRKVYADGWGLEPFRQGTPPTQEYADNRWTGPGTSTTYPRLYFDYNGNSQNRRANTWYLQDASYLRLKNLTFGYTLSSGMLSKTPITKVRLYFSGDNLLTFTKYKGLDPERTGDGRFAQYPQNKVVSVGINVEF